MDVGQVIVQLEQLHCIPCLFEYGDNSVNGGFNGISVWNGDEEKRKTRLFLLKTRARASKSEKFHTTRRSGRCSLHGFHGKGIHYVTRKLLTTL